MVALFGRKRRVNVGTYRAPEIVVRPAENVVSDGVLIAASAVRMAVKNQLIIAALRDSRDFDPEALVGVARREFLELARQNDEQAKRAWPEGDWSDNPADTEEHQRRRSIYRAMADLMRDVAANEQSLLDLVGEARESAWYEVGEVIAAKLDTPSPTVVPDEEYDRERDGRLRSLIEVDIAGLEAFSRYRDLLN